MVLNFLSQGRNPKPLDQLPAHDEKVATEADFPSDAMVRLQICRNNIDLAIH